MVRQSWRPDTRVKARGRGGVEVRWWRRGGSFLNAPDTHHVEYSSHTKFSLFLASVHARSLVLCDR